MVDDKEIMKTGTTTVALVCKDGIVLCADKRVTSGYLVAYKKYEKIVQITENIAVAPYFDVTGLVMPGMRLVEAAMHGDTMSREYYTAEGRTIVHHTDLINIGGFMQSAGHRKNILDPAVNYAGLGISAGNGIYNGKRTRGMWVTQNFARL